MLLRLAIHSDPKRAVLYSGDSQWLEELVVVLWEELGGGVLGGAWWWCNGYGVLPALLRSLGYL